MSKVRSCKRGIHFRDYVFKPLVELSRELDLSVSSIVNMACEWWLSERLTGEVKERFKVEAEIRSLIEEEKGLIEKCKVILRSGAYLPSYARKLLEGDPAEVSRFKRREGVYAILNKKELDVVLRILARREAISHRLVELLNRQLPEDRYQFGLTEKGFRLKRKGGEKP